MNYICTYPGCETPIKPTPRGKYCPVHSKLKRQETLDRQAAERHKFDPETAKLKIKPVEETTENLDCLWWRKRSCKELLEKICETGECGFYPPTAKKRKAAIREGLRG